MKKSLFITISILIIILALFWSDIIFRQRILFFFDLSGIYYPLFSLLSGSLKEGHFPLWTPHLFLGMPPAADGTMGAFYPLNILLFWLFPTLTAYRILFPLHILIVALGVYFWVRRLTKNNFSALMSAVIFSLGGYWVARALHLGIWMSGAWIPWGLWALENFLNKRRIIWPLLWSLFFGLQILAGFVQLAFYSVWITLLYALLNWKRIFPLGFKKSVFSSFSIWTIAFILSIGLGLVQLSLGWEFTKLSVRQSGVMGWAKFVGSFSPAHLLTFLSPDLFGRVRPWDIASDKINWLEIFVNYWESAVYIGIPALFLVFLGLKTYKQNRNARVLSIIALVSLLIAFGLFNPLMWLLQELPGWKYFRVYSRFNFFTTLMLAGLAGMGFKNLLELNKDEAKNWIRSLRKFCFILIIIWVGANFLGNFIFRVVWLYIANIDFLLIWDFKAHIEVIRDAFVPWNPVQWTPLILLVLTYLIFHLFHIKKLNPTIILSILFLFLLFDLFVHNATLNPSIPASVLKKEPPIAEFIKKDHYPQRILLDISSDLKKYHPEDYWQYRINFLPVPHNLIWGLDFLNSSGPIRLQRQADLMSLLSTQQKVEPKVEAKYAFLQIADVKYIITDKKFFRDGWECVFSDSSVVPVIHLYQNQNPVPRAFLVDNFVILNKKEILKSLFEDAFDLTKTALLEKTPGISHDFNNNGDISEVRRIFEGDSRFDFVVKTSKGKLLILSDTFYPGWHAYIDEKEVKIYQADYIFRAVEIPPGEHKVEFIYAPASFKIGATMSLIALFLIVVISLVLWKKSI